MTEIDPKEFGQMLARVDQLEKQVADMSADVKTLLALANQSKGGFWVGMSIAGTLGGAITYIVEKLLTR